ncbi:MAG: alpha/beta hydrolase-fold protein [Planctomycetota bacterium]
MIALHRERSLSPHQACARLVAALALLSLVFVCGCKSARESDAELGAVLALASAAPEGRLEDFELTSNCLSEFWGREIRLVAAVVLPIGYRPDANYAVCYSIHGFGGSHREASLLAPELHKQQSEHNYPRMIYVFLNAQFPMGHHEFADSVNNGPWGRALTTELIPALERKYAPRTRPNQRYLTGHSSGGWSSLWLQVNYPTLFGGTWSTAPDSVDFRDFTGIDIYAFKNAYVDPDQNDIPLMRRGEDWVKLIREYVQDERANRPIGGQFYSFNAVFSPRARDGTPMQLFDWESGQINADVAAAWRRYDISLLLRERWAKLGPLLQGKLHIYVGTLDTFRLEGATKLLKAELARLGSDAEVLLVEGRSHGSLFARHPEHWPEGMLHRIHREIFARFTATLAPPAP